MAEINCPNFGHYVNYNMNLGQRYCVHLATKASLVFLFLVSCSEAPAITPDTTAALPLPAESPVPAEPTSDSPIPDTPISEESANLTLHVLNSSIVSKEVPIQVYIDEKLELSDDFEAGSDMGIINHKTYYFKLDQGIHSLRAESTTLGAVLETEFEIRDQHWAIVGYEYSTGVDPETLTNSFGFTIQDTPIYFQ